MYYKLIRDMPSGKSVPGKLYRITHYFNKRTGLLVERPIYQETPARLNSSPRTIRHTFPPRLSP